MNLSVIVGGTEYSLDDGTWVVLTAFDGWGMAPQHRLNERGPMQHGESDVGYRLDPRFGVLVFRVNETTLAGMWVARRGLIGLFAPQSNPVLKWVLDGGAERRIACHYAGDMGMAWEQRAWAAQQVTVRLKAPDPTFYDPTAVAVTFALGGGSDAFEIPLPIPWPIGVSTLDVTKTITYMGDWLTYPHLLRIKGPITDACITNLTTGEILDFDGYTIADADYYDLDLRYGYKTVVDSTGTNKIEELTEDSDLATWHLAAAPEAPGGQNDINVTGSAVNANTEVYLQYYKRYLGI